MSENNNDASHKKKEETEWIGRYIISSSSSNTNPIAATHNSMSGTLCSSSTTPQRHKTKNACCVWTPPPPTRKQVQFLLQSLSMDIPDLTKTFKNDIEKKAVDDDTTISTFPSQQPGFMDDGFLSLDATDTIPTTHIIESTGYVKSQQELLLLSSSFNFESTTDINTVLFDREGMPMKDELVFVKSGSWEHANVLSKRLPSSTTQNISNQDQDETVSRSEDSLASFSDMSSEQLKSMSPCRSTPTRQTQSDDSDAATAYFVPIVMCLMDIPRKRYELVVMMIDWSSNTSVKQLLQELDNAIASKVGELQAQLDNDIKKYDNENKSNCVNDTNRFDVCPLETISGDAVDKGIMNYQHEDTKPASLNWSTRYDGLIQHRSPSSKKPMMMINCFDLEKYEVTEYEVFVAKPAHYSSREM